QLVTVSSSSKHLVAFAIARRWLHHFRAKNALSDVSPSTFSRLVLQGYQCPKDSKRFPVSSIVYLVFSDSNHVKNSDLQRLNLNFCFDQVQIHFPLKISTLESLPININVWNRVRGVFQPPLIS
ncbi:hypothetical protein AABB24_011096, partial [Solanum stoloniferum]